MKGPLVHMQKVRLEHSSCRWRSEGKALNQAAKGPGRPEYRLRFIRMKCHRQRGLPNGTCWTFVFAGTNCAELIQPNDSGTVQSAIWTDAKLPSLSDQHSGRCVWGKEQRPWGKQNNATGMFYRTGYSIRGQQDVEGRMWRRPGRRKDEEKTSSSAYGNSSTPKLGCTWRGKQTDGGYGAHRMGRRLWHHLWCRMHTFDLKAPFLLWETFNK